MVQELACVVLAADAGEIRVHSSKGQGTQPLSCVSQELACVDLAAEIGERALEVIRGAIEAGAAAEKEAAAQRLLRELEEEDAGKKVRWKGSQRTCQGCP